MDLGLAGKSALVLASSRGLGLGIATALAREGVNVLMTGRNAASLEAAAGEINARGAGHARYFVCDFSRADAVSGISRAVETAWGGVDLLVNNTGGPPPGGVVAMTEEVLQTQAMAMVFRVIALTNHVLPGMRARGFGRILTIASSGVLQPIPNLALSNTLRSALVGWNKTLSDEVARDGVTANVLLPGRIATARVDELDGAAAQRLGQSIDDVRQKSRESIPAGRYGTVDEFAAVATFLLGVPAAYVTGSVVRCDGGAIRGV